MRLEIVGLWILFVSSGPGCLARTTISSGSGPMCGDGVCDASEHCHSCSADCRGCTQTVAGPNCGETATYDVDAFDRVLDDFDQTEQLLLQGPEWDNTLVRNCRIHDTLGAAILMRDVHNVVIVGCEIWNVAGDSAIRTSSTGGTENVTIDDNYIHDVQESGISIAQRVAEGIHHTTLRILRNVVENSGLGSSDGSHNAISSQVQDALVEGNSVIGSRDGNGISVQSSAVVRCNRISGTSSGGKPGIRYYSAHQTGPSASLVIEHNVVTNIGGTGIDLYPPTDRYDGQTGDAHVVKEFAIQYNEIDATVPIKVAPEYQDAPFTVWLLDNSGS